MAKSYEAIQEQLEERLRERFGLTSTEGLLILDDILLNLEGMASDWVGKRGKNCPPEWRPERIVEAIEVCAMHLECEDLANIAQQLRTALAEEDSDPEALRPLLDFLAGIREAMPPVPE